MQLRLNANHLTLIDRVLASGRLGASRDEVLNNAVVEHARLLLTGGSAFEPGASDALQVDAPDYGPVREDRIIPAITGKALPVRAGEVLRISQVDGGTCVDYNACNLDDYRERLDCGFNRHRGVSTGRGALMWSGSPRARPIQAILDFRGEFHQYYQGHRCNGVMWEIEYGLADHPNCQDTLAEAIREYDLTPDDVQDSYNLWMHTDVSPDGQRRIHWNRARRGDYVDIIALIDTLSVAAVCGGDITPTNNYDPGAIRLQVHAATPSTLRIVDAVRERFGRFAAQKTADDFRLKAIRAERRLERNPSYVPDFLPRPAAASVEVALSPEAGRLLDALLATGGYLETREQALLHCFLRWYDAQWPRERITTKLALAGPGSRPI